MHLLKPSVAHRDSPQNLFVLRFALNSLLENFPLVLVALQSETLNRKGFWGAVAPASFVVSKSHLVASLVAQSNAWAIPTVPASVGYVEPWLCWYCPRAWSSSCHSIAERETSSWKRHWWTSQLVELAKEVKIAPNSWAYGNDLPRVDAFGWEIEICLASCLFFSWYEEEEALMKNQSLIGFWEIWTQILRSWCNYFMITIVYHDNGCAELQELTPSKVRFSLLCCFLSWFSFPWHPSQFQPTP